MRRFRSSRRSSGWAPSERLPDRAVVVERPVVPAPVEQRLALAVLDEADPASGRRPAARARPRRRSAATRCARAPAQGPPAAAARRPRAARRAQRRRQRGVAARREPGGEALVAGEQLVAAVARERDGHVPARHLAQQEGRDRARVAERLVVVPDEPLDEVDGVGLDDELVVVGAVPLARPAARTGARRSRRGPRSRS